VVKVILQKGRIAPPRMDGIVPVLCNGPPLPPQNCPFPWGSVPYLTWILGPYPSPQVTRHLDRFSRFAHNRQHTDQQTNKQTTLLRL